jgi:hypothetical protein
VKFEVDVVCNDRGQVQHFKYTDHLCNVKKEWVDFPFTMVLNGAIHSELIRKMKEKPNLPLDTLLLHIGKPKVLWSMSYI